MKTLNYDDLSKSKKIITYKDAVQLIKGFQKKKEVIIYTSGGFDLLHTGHVRYLRAARSIGDYLFVGLESDKTLKNTKGKNRPVNSISERLEILSSLSSVSYVFELTQELQSYDSATKVFIQRYKTLHPDFVAAPKETIKTNSQLMQIEKAGCKPVIIDTPAVGKKTSSKIKTFIEYYI